MTLRERMGKNTKRYKKPSADACPLSSSLLCLLLYAFLLPINLRLRCLAFVRASSALQPHKFHSAGVPTCARTSASSRTRWCCSHCPRSEICLRLKSTWFSPNSQQKHVWSQEKTRAGSSQNNMRKPLIAVDCGWWKPVKFCIAQVAFKMPAFNSGVSWKWNAHSHTTTVPDYHITTTTSLSQPACDITHCHGQVGQALAKGRFLATT